MQPSERRHRQEEKTKQTFTGGFSKNIPKQIKKNRIKTKLNEWLLPN